MKRRIFIGSFFTAVSVILLCMLISAIIFSTYYTNNQKEQLEKEFSYLSHMMDEHGTDHIRALATSDRIAVVSKDGEFIIRGSDADLWEEDFTERKEFEDAEAEEQILSRYLTATKKQLCIYKETSDGNILCLYDTTHTFVSLLITLCPYIGAILIITAIVSLILSRRISISILKPVWNLDLQNPDSTDIYPELLPLVDKINSQNEKITAHLTELENQHESQDKMRREFTANVSHELKTPLTSISGYAEIMRDGLVQGEDVKKFSGKIFDESQRMINLVGDIIKLSQLDEKDITVKMERINLLECAKAVVYSLEHQAGKKNITITVEGDEAYINGAEVIIEEIIHNLCENAIKYNKENGRVDVLIKQCIDGVEFSVTDTGIGIPKADLERVFERFYRVDKSHSKEIGGTGLGLSIVKHGAMFHNASVSIDSKLSKGTTVRILF